MNNISLSVHDLGHIHELTVFFLHLCCYVYFPHCSQCLSEGTPAGRGLGGAHPLLHHLSLHSDHICGKIFNLQSFKNMRGEVKIQTKIICVPDNVFRVMQDILNGYREEGLPERERANVP